MDLPVSPDCVLTLLWLHLLDLHIKLLLVKMWIGAFIEFNVFFIIINL